ncbi:MAG: hypothetical protein ACQER9_02230 [Nanobdellota archaeon]
MADDSGQITYEKLFDFLREERNSVQLKSLPDSFYSDVIEYLKLKEESLESLKNTGSPSYDSSADQLRNAKKLIENIYERREKKILNIALSKSRTKSELIDMSPLLEEEKVLFKQMFIVLDHFRNEILNKILLKQKPEINENKDSVQPQSVELNSASKKNKDKEEENKENTKENEEELDENKDVPESNSSKIAVKFIKYVDKFVDPDLNIIGPFEEGSVCKLQDNIVEMLVSKGLAERVD